MDDNRKKLRALIEAFRLPLTDKEMEEHLSNLSDEDIQELIDIYTDVDAIQEDIAGIAGIIDPEESEKIDREYFEKLSKLDKDYLKKKEEIQESIDSRLTDMEKDSLNYIRKESSRIVSDVDKTNDLRNSLNSTIASTLSSE